MADIANQPLVSVIIPTHNRAEIVTRAIASVQSQTYQHWEIIIVDDASQDNTVEIIQQLDDSRLRYISHETNLGGSEARNTGIKQAQGEYIAFLDSDDVWLPNKLRSQLAAIAQAESTQNIVCYSQFQKSDRVFYQRSILPSQGKKQASVADYLWLSGGEMLTSTLLVSRNIATATLFNSGLIKHQDLDFVIRLEQQGAKFIFVPQVLAIWHNEPRGDRISRKVNYQVSLDWIEQYCSQISDRAYLGFLLKEIVPKMIKKPAKKAQARDLIFQALGAGVISIPYGLYLLVKAAIPRSYQQKLIEIIKPN